MVDRAEVGGVSGVLNWLQSDGCKDKKWVNMGGADTNMNTFKSGFQTDLCLAPESAASIADLVITNDDLGQF